MRLKALTLTRYAQIDPAWAGHLLGSGPDTIGSAGCYVVTDADLMTWLAQGASGAPRGSVINPDQLNTLYRVNGIYVSGDLLRDTALHEAFPDIWTLISTYTPPGAADLTTCDNTGEDYVVVFIRYPNGLLSDKPHFMPVWSYKAGGAPSTLLVADSYDGAVKPLANYGDPATIICKVLHFRPAAVLPPQPTPSPLPLPPLRVMYDSIEPAAIPVDATLILRYIDGNWGRDWKAKGSAYGWDAAASARFTKATFQDITVTGIDDGHWIDCESGDATPDYCPGWVQRRRSHGVNAGVYMPESLWADVRSEFQKQGVAEPPYIVAKHAPGAPPPIPAGAVGLQYANPSMTLRHYDLTEVGPDFPPPPINEGSRNAVVRLGIVIGPPPPPSWFLDFIRKLIEFLKSLLPGG